MSISFSEMSQKDFEALPVPVRVEKEDQYADLINSLEQGKIVAFDYTDAKDLRGKRITIGRKAHARGFTVEFRVNGTKVAVRKNSDTLPEPKPVKHRVKKES